MIGFMVTKEMKEKIRIAAAKSGVAMSTYIYNEIQKALINNVATPADLS